MVRGLKVLRHKRTEAGYFNEFLIAKTPDDVENCLPGAEEAVTAASGAAVETQSLLQAGAFGSSAHDAGRSDWQHQLQSHSAAQLQQQLCFGHSDPEQRIVTQPAVAMATTDIARQEVVTTTGDAAGGRHFGATTARPLDMAAGMSKMKIDFGCTRDSSRRYAGASTLDAQPSAMDSQLRRRERNRAAAARCRKKRQDQLDGLAEAVRDLETENASLESRVAALMAVRSDLLRRLSDHRVTCPEIQKFSPDCDLEIALDTELVSLATTSESGEEILLTPSLLLPPPLPHRADMDSEFKLEPL